MRIKLLADDDSSVDAAFAFCVAAYPHFGLHTNIEYPSCMSEPKCERLT